MVTSRGRRGLVGVVSLAFSSFPGNNYLIKPELRNDTVTCTDYVIRLSYAQCIRNVDELRNSFTLYAYIWSVVIGCGGSVPSRDVRIN